MELRPAAANGYVPRDTQGTDLLALLHEHLDDFLERTRGPNPDWRLPRFAQNQLRGILQCGDITQGFLRLECPECRAGRVVPFS